MIINPYLFLDPVFNGVTAAWPMSEATNKMRREVFGSTADFLPIGVTNVSNQSKLSGGLNSYMTAPDIGLSLSTDQAFTWCFTLKPSSLGAGTFDILTKGHGVFGANAEYRVYLSSSTLNFRLYYSTSSAVTVSATLTNGVDNIIFLVHDPVNDIISIKVNTSSPTTTAHTGGCRAKYGALTVGNTCGYPYLDTLTDATPSLPLINTTSFNGAISNLIFWKGTALTSTQQATVRTVLTTTGFPWGALSEVDYTLDPDTYSSVSGARNYDFTDLTGQWQNTAKTTAVTANNDPVRVIECQWSSDEATAVSDAARPLCKTGTLNGGPTVYTDGSTSKMTLSNPLQSSSGDYVLFIIAKNDANARSPAGGSHWMEGGGGTYVAHTGFNYGSGAQAGYLAAHMSSGSSPNNAVNSTQVCYPQSFNILEMHNVSQVWSALCNGYFGFDGSREVGNANPLILDTLFENAPSKVAAEWWAIGNLAEIIFIPATISRTDRARIRNFIAIKHAITVAHSGY